MYSVAKLLRSLADYLEKKDTLTDEELTKLSFIFSHLEKITKLSEKTHSENLSIYLHKPTAFTNLGDLEEKLWEAYIDLRNEYIRLKTMEFYIDIGKTIGWSSSKETEKEIKYLIDLIYEAFGLDNEEKEL
jgi:hypothetical protein